MPDLEMDSPVLPRGAGAPAAPQDDDELLRNEGRRVGAVVLVCYLVDAALLAAFAAQGTVAWGLSVLYAAVGVVVVGLSHGLAAHFGPRLVADTRLVLAQSSVAVAVVLGAAFYAPALSSLMILTAMGVIATSALRLPLPVLLAQMGLTTAAMAGLAMHAGGLAPFPVRSLGEQVVTTLFLAWTLLKVASVNAIGAQLRNEVSRSHARLAQALSDVERLASVDELTALPNRRAILRRLAATREHMAPTDPPMGLAMLDLDFFKQINDKHGHPTGDEVLRRTGAVLQQVLRRGDLVGRVGGEEFLLLVPGPTQADTLHGLGERTRAGIEGNDWAAILPGLKVTASVGMTLGWPGESVAQWLARADRALYRAKAQGRNRVVLALDAADEPLLAAGAPASMAHSVAATSERPQAVVA